MDWYCSALAGGGGDGSVSSPWTLAEGNTAWGDGTIGNTDKLWLKADGIYTTGDTIWAVNGLANKKVLSGYTAAIDDGGKATIQRSGGAGILVNVTSQQAEIRDLIIDGQNSGTYNLQIMTYDRAINIESKNAGSDGLYLSSTSPGHFINCYAHDNAAYGIRAIYAFVSNCLTVNNGNRGISNNGGTASSISKGNAVHNIYASGYPGSIINCISDGGTGHGLEAFVHAIIMNCIIINSPAGKYGVNLSAIGGAAFNCNFFGNDADISDATRNFNGQTLDPQFKDPANLDYTRTGTNLDDKGFSEVGMVAAADYNIDIGPDQGAGPDYPLEADVEDGVTFDYGAKEGTFEAPAEDDVRNGIGYGAGGAEYDGDLVVPAEANVRDGVGYGADAVEYEGALDLPAVGDVEKGVVFDGATKTGTFKEPGIGNVEKDVEYGADDTEFTGTFKVPDENQVQKSVGYGEDGTEFSGTLETAATLPVSVTTEKDGEVSVTVEVE